MKFQGVSCIVEVGACVVGCIFITCDEMSVLVETGEDEVLVEVVSGRNEALVKVEASDETGLSINIELLDVTGVGVACMSETSAEADTDIIVRPLVPFFNCCSLSETRVGSTSSAGIGTMLLQSGAFPIVNSICQWTCNTR